MLLQLRIICSSDYGYHLSVFVQIMIQNQGIQLAIILLHFHMRILMSPVW